MSYKSTTQGGLIHLCAIECKACRTRTPAESFPEFAWAAARGAGWVVPPASYRGPYCPDCAPMFHNQPDPKAAA